MYLFESQILFYHGAGTAGVNGINALNQSLQKGVAGFHSNHFELNLKKFSSLHKCNRTQLIFLHHI